MPHGDWEPREDALTAATLAEAKRLLDADPARAATLARTLVAAAPGAAEPRFVLAAALRRCCDPHAALALLGPLAGALPKLWGVQYEHGMALLAVGRADAAATALARAAALNPRSGLARHALAAAHMECGDAAAAVADYAAALALEPGHAGSWLGSGHALRAVGRQADAVAAYRRAIELRPGAGEAWWSLANLKTWSFEPGDIDRMTALLPTAGHDDRTYLHFALGKAFEDAHRYEPAFTQYAAGNAARREVLPHDADAASDFVARSIGAFTQQFFAARAGSGDPAPDPIFVLGMPRSGSTLVEQILASHSAVEGASELPDITALAREAAAGRPYPEALATLPAGAFAALGAEYLARTRLRRPLGRPRFVDKFPGNWAHAGLIHLILPNATIIDVRRDPLACCVSLYKQVFAAGQSYAYDLADLGRAYVDYEAMMAHLDEALPGRILRVRYEALVDDPEAETRRLLDHAGLAFEPACLRFFETERAIRTPSSEQVRQPINRDGLDQWRHFEPWLDPLRDALGPAAGGG